MDADDGTRYRISIDTGGTFTDVVLSDSNGHVSVGKAFTSQERVFGGLRAALETPTAELGVSVESVLARTDVLIYGTTHATNAVVTGKTAKTGFIVTEGFGDTLYFREGGRRNAFDSHAQYPGPYVPKRNTYELRERITAEGEILKKLDEGRLDKLIDEITASDIEAVGVMLLWSVANPAHEKLVGQRLQERCPDLPFSLSHETNPVMREYRRASAAVIDASLKPLMRKHLNELSADLAAAGFSGQFLVVTSEGGVLDAVSVASSPLLAVNSGPSMAPLAGAEYVPNEEAVVVCDIGGTTFDVSIVESGVLRHTRDLWLGEPFVGEMTGLSSVAVKSIGAGGGSIAWIDAGGMIRVGPQSAGSVPGPAAYGMGGQKATITDAAVVLGFLDPVGFAGDFELSVEAATSVIDQDIAGPLKMSSVQAASSVFAVAANQMATAVRQSALEEGVDPRGAVVVAGGGAGPLLSAFVAEVLECERVVVPRDSGVLAAYGAHWAEILTERALLYSTTSVEPDIQGVEDVLRELDRLADNFFERFAESDSSQSRTYFAEGRYPGQGWELRILFDERPSATENGLTDINNAFHKEHERRNGTYDPASPIEYLSWGVRIGVRYENHKDPIAAVKEDGIDDLGQAPSDARRNADAYFDGKSITTPRFSGGLLSAGWEADGPAVIDEQTTTIIVPPDWQVRIVQDGSYHMNRRTKKDRQ